MPEPHARLRLRRTGGLAGVATEAALDTAELDPAEARPVLEALDAADLAALAGHPPTHPGMPDAFRYELEVRRGEQAHTIAFTDADRPAALAPVIDALAARAKPAPRRR
jgi:hypothetical protein